MKKDKKNIIGSVLVAGAGIGGMQSALDLAESGFKVYLLDTASGIGGTMAKLDKTFPTNDCAMCVMSPKLVECGRHHNIEIITLADIESIDGEAGNFKVNLVHRPRYIDVEKCTGCGECGEVCPVEIPNEFDAFLGNKRAIHKLYPQAVPRAFTISKGDTPPCGNGCPAKINVQGYAALASQGKYKEALALINETAPLAGILGRICHHPCENECNRAQVDSAIAICELKRFIADKNRIDGDSHIEKIIPTKTEKVAVIGCGPAGLTCAEKLLKMGYPVTVFDESRIPGGMITSCIPDYRIPTPIALYDIERVIKRGIEYRGDVRIGKDKTLKDLEREGYKAVFIAIGLQKPKTLNIEGATATGLHYGIPFLKTVKTGKKINNFGKKVIVIGGGNVAIDCAKTALRMGASEVHLVCLETRDLTCKDRMPAHDWEIEEAEEEGVVIHPYLGPKRILVKNREITGLECIECYSVYEEDGKFNPQFKQENEFTIPGDTVIIAIGQECDGSGFENLFLKSNKKIEFDVLTLGTSVKGVFAGGDVVRGPSSVIQAIADGNRAALSIDRYLRHVDLKEGREEKEPVLAKLPERTIELKSRAHVNKRPPDTRRRDFEEIETGFESEVIAIEEAKRCLNCGVCSQCFECVKVCEAEAIQHTMVEKRTQLTVGSVVLAPGFELYDAHLRGEYGFGLYSNVITHLQLERMLSASGPSMGQVFRPSDHKPPKKIAFILCVGSRDSVHGNAYCSTIGCMSSTKEAVIIKEHDPEVDISIFYLDMRTFGKGFEQYLKNAEGEHGIKFVRSMISKITELQQSKNLKIRYAKDQSIEESEFDMVVLTCALNSSKKARTLAHNVGIDLNEYGFCHTDEFFTTITSRPGIFTAGLFNEPKDIPDTVVEASSAAAEASRLLSPVRGTMVKKREYPPERSVEREPLRIGVFVCRCGRNIGSVVDVPQVVEYAKKMPDVVFADENLYTCSQDSLEKIKKIVEEHKLNRVVVASCTPLTHAPIFRDTIRSAGLNPYLFELVSIREHCAWVHMNDHKMATEKAMQLVAVGVAKVRLLKPIKLNFFEVNRKVLIIGGGPSGMSAAINIAEQGFEVYLIEKKNNLGGNLRNIYSTLQGGDVQELMKNMIQRIFGNRKIHVYTTANIQETSGYLGNFKTKIYLQKEEKFLELEHGAIIVATGAEEYKPTEYLYGEDERIITQLELEGKLANNQLLLRSRRSQDQGAITPNKTIVMIQCVGSRNDEHPYCSRVCCTHAIKNALKIKKLNPDAKIFVLFRDIRTYGFSEKYYHEARKKGVLFIRYDEKHKPSVTKVNGQIHVTLRDPVLNEEIILTPDFLVLNAGIVPRNEELARILKLPLTSDGFFLEAHAKIRPVDFSAGGIFVCGLAHSPRSIRESISQAHAAAIKVIQLLSREKLEAKAEIPEVKDKWCSGCGLCIEVCQYGARELDKERRVSKVLEAICQGCGACAAVCPNGATQQREFESREIFSMIDVVAGD
jgi:heterodisulfide reductase subunit A-like polyferredoxin